MDTLQLRRQVAEVVRNQPVAVEKLVTYFESLFPHAAAHEDMAAVMVLYGPSSVGKSTAAAFVTLMMLDQSGVELTPEAVRDPERALERRCVEDRATELACLTISMADYGNKPAQVMDLLAARFEAIREQFDEHEADPDLPSPQPFLRFMIDEIQHANKAVLQQIAEIAVAGVIPVRKVNGKSVPPMRCPCRLIILLVGNSPPDSVMMRTSVPTQKQVVKEVRRVLFKGVERVFTRFVHWIVPFYPYTKVQWASILQTCLDRLRQGLCQRLGIAHLFLDASCTIAADRVFRVHDGCVRSAMKQLSVMFDAAVMPNKQALSTWPAVLLRRVGSDIVAEPAEPNIGHRSEALQLANQPVPHKSRAPQRGVLRSDDDDDVVMTPVEEDEQNEPPTERNASTTTTIVATHLPQQAAVPPSPAQQHLQQIVLVWHAVHAFLNDDSSCTFVADPSVVGLCHRAFQAQYPAAVGAELQEAHRAALNTICLVWLGSCKQWCIAHAKTHERVLRIRVDRPSESALRFSVRALDDEWDMCDVDICTAQHPYPHGAVYKATFQDAHNEAVAETNAVQWINRIRSIPLFNDQQSLGVLMLSLAEGDANLSANEIQERMRVQRFPWYYDGPGSCADPRQFFVLLDGLVEYDSVKTFTALDRSPTIIDVPTVRMRASPDRELVPYVPLSSAVLQAMFGLTPQHTAALYERARSAFRPDRNGRWAHLYVGANPEAEVQRNVRTLYKQRLGVSLSVKVGFVPLLELQQLGRDLPSSLATATGAQIAVVDEEEDEAEGQRSTN